MTAATTSLPLTPADDRPAVNPWLIAVVVSMATFMEVLDTSIANVSLRHIAGSLAAGLDESTWVLTSYLVSNAIILPVSGYLSTLFGRKRFYIACVAVFTVSSLLCGLAPSLGWLIVFRVLQGAGGGGLAPSEQAILADTFPPAKRGMAFAVYGIAVVVAPAVGPTLGGWITDHYSWRWIFFINVPVGVISCFLSYTLVPESASEKKERREFFARGAKVDYLGFGLIAVGLGALQIVLDKGQEEDWFGSSFITIFTIVAGVCLVLCVIRELTVDEPVVDLPLLKNRNFLVSNLLMFALGFILFGTTQLIPQFVQELLGYTATDAGLVISPGGFVVMAMMPLVGFLVSRTQPKWLILFGFLMTAASLWHMTGFNTQISYAHAAWARVFQAAGIAFLFVPINTISYAGLPPGKSNNASALLNLFRNLGGSVGISMANTMIARRSQLHQSRLVEHINPFNPAYRRAAEHLGTMFSTRGMAGGTAAGPEGSRGAAAVFYRMVGRQAAMLSYIDVFWFMCVSSLVVCGLVLLLRRVKPGEARAAAH